MVPHFLRKYPARTPYIRRLRKAIRLKPKFPAWDILKKNAESKISNLQFDDKIT